MLKEFNIEKAAIMIALVVAGAYVVRQASAENWKKFTSAEGAFTCMMPTTPKSEIQPMEAHGMKVEAHIFTASDRANSIFTVSYVDGSKLLTVEEGEKMLDRQGQNLTQGDESRMLLAQKLALKGYSGRHYRANTENNTETDEMVYLVGRRLYTLLVVHDNNGAQDMVRRFFDSFAFEQP